MHKTLRLAAIWVATCAFLFVLAGFTAVEQLKPEVYRVKNFARNGQLLSRNVTNLPEIATANSIAPAAAIAISKSNLTSP
jgi:hypothetical protein